MLAKISHGGTKSATDNRKGEAARPKRWGNRRIAAMALASMGTGCMLVAPGCAAAPVIIAVAIEACLEAVKRILDQPGNGLPTGYRSCGSINWTVRESSIKACTFCNPLVPDRVFIQFDCAGPYYPMDIERVRDRYGMKGGAADPLIDTGERFIEKIECDQYFFMSVMGEVSGEMQWFELDFESPNDRMLPDWSHYPTLEVSVNGDGEAAGHYPATAGSRVHIEGSLDDVAHYAMTAGVSEFGFKNGADHWEVFLNSDLSAAMVFRNGVHDESRILFAPTPRP